MESYITFKNEVFLHDLDMEGWPRHLGHFIFKECAYFLACIMHKNVLERLAKILKSGSRYWGRRRGNLKK